MSEFKPGFSELECDYCHVQEATLSKCAKCQKNSYCSVECQKKDWKKHEAACALNSESKTGKSMTIRCLRESEIRTNDEKLALCMFDDAYDYSNCDPDDIRKGVQLFQDAADMFEKLEHWCCVAECYHGISTFCLRAGDLDKAESFFQKLVYILRKIVNTASDPEQLRFAYRLFCFTSLSLSLLFQKSQDALELLNEVLAVPGQQVSGLLSVRSELLKTKAKILTTLNRLDEVHMISNQCFELTAHLSFHDLSPFDKGSICGNAMECAYDCVDYCKAIQFGLEAISFFDIAEDSILHRVPVHSVLCQIVAEEISVLFQSFNDSNCEGCVELILKVNQAVTLFLELFSLVETYGINLSGIENLRKDYNRVVKVKKIVSKRIAKLS